MLKPKNLILITLTFALVFMAISFISAAETSGSFNVDTGGANIIIDPDGCDEDWSGSTWSQCINEQQRFICFDKNPCGTEDLRPALCGEVRECGVEEDDPEQPPPSSSGGGGGSGGGSSGGSGGGGSGAVLLGDGLQEQECTENWVCEEWSNSDKSCGARVCEDENQCGTTVLKPETSESCPASISWLTGAVIGVFGTGGTFVLFFIILIVIVAGFIIARNYKLKKQ